ncbi:MAG: endonuclease/exonuclease/phosphatase family protein, partial [Nocardioidaceae bacterium]|nr:endonuclease/exonuclease/phosphatase family protein [Nocardioidaceae bacterium]
WLRTDALAGTFSQACQTIEGTTHDNQSVFVRDATYEVVDGSQGGLRFDAPRYDDPTHGACWAKIRERASGLEVVIVGLHLRDGTGTANDRVRAAETAELMDRVAQAHPDTPVVFAGDSNSTRTRALDGPRVELAKGGYLDAYEESALYRTRPYRNSACGPTGAVRKSTTWGDHIDRVFAPPGVHVSSWEVDYRIKSTSRYQTPLASDHNPVVVSLLFAPPAPSP